MTLSYIAACGHDLLSVQHVVQSDVDAIQAWLCVNRLQLNVSKSAVMLISSRQKINHRNVTIHISGQTLTQIPCTKYLGVFIDQHLTWQKHTEYVLKRIRGKVHCLYRLLPLSDAILFQLYRSFILPVIDYTATLSKSMERIHARFVGHTSNDTGFVKVTLAERHHFHSIINYSSVQNFTSACPCLPSGYVCLFCKCYWSC